MLVLLAKILVALLIIIVICKVGLKPSSTCIDNTVFRLHYKITTAVLLVCCLLVASVQYLGDPITCSVDGEEHNGNVIDKYCWNRLTIAPSHVVDKEIKQIPQPGVATPEDGDELKYHKYYQWPWVCLMLFFQAMLFFFPHFLWKVLEGGKCKMMTKESPNEKPSEKLERIASYFTQTTGTHNCYAFSFFFCEVLNLFNVLAQLFFMHLYLGYELTTCGPGTAYDYSSMHPEDHTEPMKLVFPKMAMCTFQEKPGQCVLSINSVNEKIYVMLWFWFVALAVVTGLTLLFRFAVLLFRSRRLHWPVKGCWLASPGDVRLVEENCRIGDWLFLCQIGQNMKPIAFKEFILELKHRLCG